MSESTLKNKTAKGLFWGGMSNGVQQILGVAFGIYLARTLNADDYGLVGMLAIFSGIASTLINSGLAVALTNKRDASQKDYNAVFWFSIIVGLISYVTLFTAAPLIAQFYGRPELTSLARVLFISFFVSGAALVSHTILFKQLKIKEIAKADIIAMLASGIVGVSLALFGWAYWALALQSVVFISTGSILRIVFSRWKPSLEIDFSPLKTMLPFSINLFLTNIFQQISGNIFSVVLGKFYNATQLGYYSQGYKWATMGNQFLSGMINSVSQPIFVQTSDEKERQVNVFRKMIRFSAFVSFPLMLGLAFVGKEFITIALGEKWLFSLVFLQLFCIWNSVGNMYSLYTNMIMAHGKSKIYLYGTVFMSIIQILSIISMFSLGPIAMVVAYIIANMCGMFFWHYHVNKLISLKITHVIKDMSPYFIATCTSLGIAWAFSTLFGNIYLIFICKVVVATITYCLILYFYNSVIFKESMDFILRKR